MEKRVYADTAGYLPSSVFDGTLYDGLNVLGIHRYLSVFNAHYRIFLYCYCSFGMRWCWDRYMIVLCVLHR